MKYLYLSLFILLVYSCQMKEQGDINSTPFAIVVKYISAENFIDTLEAKKYIDINRVFNMYVDKENPSAQKVWENLMMFNKTLNENNKFTNHFKFYEYDFQESVENKRATVLFVSKNKKTKIKRILYSLELSDNNQWKIINIKYEK